MTGAPPVHVVLVEPLIPQNTGSVGRLCVATGARLHLVRPLGFDISEKAVRRAGLDYWKHVDLHVHDDFEQCKTAIDAPVDRWWYLSSHAQTAHTAVSWRAGDVLVFGKETTGLGAAFLGDDTGEPRPNAVTVPLFGPVRSLNLSTTVGIVVYEALRQIRPDQLPSSPLHGASP